MSRITRRRWMLATFALLLTRPLGLFSTLTGCSSSGDEESDPILRVPVADIPPEGRIERQQGRVVVELRREDGEIRARSMLCSHQFCRVQWQPDENHYLCPCDDGLFAADGSVKYGRARRPLRDLEYQTMGEEIWIDTRQVYRLAPLPEEVDADAR